MIREVFFVILLIAWDFVDLMMNFNLRFSDTCKIKGWEGCEVWGL